MTKPSWFDDWVTGELDWDDDDVVSALNELRQKPSHVQEMLVEIPPSSVVKARPGKKYRCPAPGKVAIVTSIFEDGHISVREHPDAVMHWQVPVEDVEFVAAHKGLTREKMKEILFPD